MPDDILIRITVANRGPESATLHLLPTLWFRNTWTWKCAHEGTSIKPQIRRGKGNLLVASHETLGNFFLAIGVSPDGGEPRVLFTGNETNSRRLWNFGAGDGFVKDAFHEYIVRGRQNAARLNGVGTKAASHYILSIPAGASQTVKLRLFAEKEAPAQPLDETFDQIFDARIREAHEFYSSISSAKLNDDERNVIRQAYAGLLWSKQFYHYIVQDWLTGDPGMHRRNVGSRAAILNGNIFIVVTSFPCRINGSIPGSQLGTWLST